MQNDEQGNGMSRRDMIQLATNGISLALVAGFPSVSLAVVPSQAGKSAFVSSYEFLCLIILLTYYTLC